MKGQGGFALKRMRLVEASFESPNAFPGSADRKFSIRDATIKHELDEADRTCLVKVGIDVSAEVKESEAFSLSATIEGLFEGDQEGLGLEQFARINAPAILFPYLREIISNLSARSGHPAVLLPTVNFLELARLYEEGSLVPDPTQNDAKTGQS